MEGIARRSLRDRSNANPSHKEILQEERRIAEINQDRYPSLRSNPDLLPPNAILRLKPGSDDECKLNRSQLQQLGTPEAMSASTGKTGTREKTNSAEQDSDALGSQSSPAVKDKSDVCVINKMPMNPPSTLGDYIDDRGIIIDSSGPHINNKMPIRRPDDCKPGDAYYNAL
jgi:hypothetical protein